MGPQTTVHQVVAVRALWGPTHSQASLRPILPSAPVLSTGPDLSWKGGKAWKFLPACSHGLSPSYTEKKSAPPSLSLAGLMLTQDGYSATSPKLGCPFVLILSSIFALRSHNALPSDSSCFSHRACVEPSCT